MQCLFEVYVTSPVGNGTMVLNCSLQWDIYVVYDSAIRAYCRKHTATVSFVFAEDQPTDLKFSTPKAFHLYCIHY